MFDGEKTKKILQENDAQKSIIELDNLLTPIFYKNPEKLTSCEKNIVYIEKLEREVNNGGFNQFFFNSSGDYIMETLNALEIIQSKNCYDILKRAIEKWPNNYLPSDRYERQDILLDIDSEYDLWEDLDTEFYKYEEDIYSLLLKYIRENIENFR